MNREAGRLGWLEFDFGLSPASILASVETSPVKVYECFEESVDSNNILSCCSSILFGSDLSARQYFVAVDFRLLMHFFGVFTRDLNAFVKDS